MPHAIRRHLVTLFIVALLLLLLLLAAVVLSRTGKSFKDINIKPIRLWVIRRVTLMVMLHFFALRIYVRCNKRGAGVDNRWGGVKISKGL